MGICTGEYLDDEVPHCASIGSPCVIGGEPVSNELFNASSTSQFSRIFQVSEGACVQLTAYSLAGGTVQIQKLYMDPSANLPVEEAGSCAPVPQVDDPAILACKNICDWQLTDCNDLRYICAQGHYRLMLTPPEAVGQAFVVIERMKSMDNPVPEELVFGGA